MTYQFGKTVTYIDRTVTGTNSDGNDTFTDVPGVDTTAVFAPGGSAEITTGGDQVTTQPTLYGVDPSLGVKALDRFIIDGDPYEVDGDPQTGWQSPFTGWAPGTVVALRRVKG